MFDFREFLMKGLLDSIGKEAEYKVRDNAAGWYDKGVLTEDDLAEIDARYPSIETETAEQ
jgi:hypothetical protein